MKLHASLDTSSLVTESFSKAELVCRGHQLLRPGDREDLSSGSARTILLGLEELPELRVPVSAPEMES